MLFASGDSGPSLLLIREIQSLRSDELAKLLLDDLSAGLADFLPDGVIASLTPDKVRVRPQAVADRKPKERARSLRRGFRLPLHRAC